MGKKHILITGWGWFHRSGTQANELLRMGYTVRALDSSRTQLQRFPTREKRTGLLKRGKVDV